MYRRLLVPLDGSRLAETILAVVERLAAAYGATVVLLHVIERGAPATVHGERHLRTALEALITVLVLVVAGCYVAELFLSGPNVGQMA